MSPTSASTVVFPEGDVALPKGSLILVTGATGYIAGHIINEALLLGYKVRGTVRSEEKGEQIKKTFSDEKFETVVISDLTDSHAFDKACEGCDGVIHAATVVNFSPDPNEVIPPTVAGAVNALRSAKRAGTVKRFVYTSSSTAATMPVLDRKFSIGKDTWNEVTVNRVKQMREPFKQEDAMDVYGASKTEAERAVWEFVRAENPEFVVNTVLPNANFGKVIADTAGATGGFVISIFKGQFQPMFPPQWFVDTADDAKVHLAALVDKTVANERIFAFAEPWDYNDIFDAIRRARPDATKVPKSMPPHGRDLSQVENEQGAELLRKWFGQNGWKSLADAIKENVEGL